MRAIAIDYQCRRVRPLDMPEPSGPGGGEVVFRVHEVGVCGTDRELADFHFGYPPEGETVLVPGHEALGQVTEAGLDAPFAKGDWVVPMVRRACSPACPSCVRGRRDLCVTGNYRERGIFGLHGYFSEWALDNAEDLVKVPENLVDFAVLLEPLSVVEKAVETALRIHEPGARTALVLGAGPIGVLAALALQLRGLAVSLHSLEPKDHPRARLVRDAGICYLERAQGMTADIVVEATGSPQAALAGLALLAPLGVYGVLGGTVARGELRFVDLLRHNQTVFGSVNASPQAFRCALEDLARFDRRVLGRMIRRTSFREFGDSFEEPPGAALKTVHVLAE